MDLNLALGQVVPLWLYIFIFIYMFYIIIKISATVPPYLQKRVDCTIEVRPLSNMMWPQSMLLILFVAQTTINDLHPTYLTHVSFQITYIYTVVSDGCYKKTLQNDGSRFQHKNYYE